MVDLVGNGDLGPSVKEAEEGLPPTLNQQKLALIEDLWTHIRGFQPTHREQKKIVFYS